jgi:hypothetical protein
MVVARYKDKYVGVHCDVYYIDETPDEAQSVYISFADCDPVTDDFYDENGTADGLVFYYATLEEWDIMRYGQNVGVDFMVLPDTIAYEEMVKQ